MRYLHYAPREEDVRLVAEAFAIEQPHIEPIELADGRAQ
jgi:hypothetical protein